MVFETIISRNIRLSEAPSFGVPALSYDVSSKGAQAYLSLARELLQKNNMTKLDHKEAAEQ
jgi:chromosome partitioning protein